ncbi:MAG: SLOG family protein [Saprospiraceae bacterium]|nr:SLOG family protein [Saprospiraceae bacterium]
MKLLITGSREAASQELLHIGIAHIVAKFQLPDEIIHGGAKGYDQLAKKWARTYQRPETEIKPDYNKHYGKVAPLIRNIEMIKLADLTLAIYSTNDPSGGTWYTAQKTIQANKPLLEVFPNKRTRWTLPTQELL